MQQCQLLVDQTALTEYNQLLSHEINGHGIDGEIPPEKILLQCQVPPWDFERELIDLPPSEAVNRDSSKRCNCPVILVMLHIRDPL